jgi:Uncharacterized conserved protein
MCRNIKPLYNFEPATTHDEIRNAAVQFVRKVSGMTKPAKVNEEAFERAIHDVTHSIEHLLSSLVTTASPKNREVEAAKGRAKADARYARIAQTYGRTES